MQELIGKAVCFTSKIEEMDSYPEKGMRGRIISITEEDTDAADLHEHVYIIKFDYTEFDQFNTAFESANYYGSGRVPCLTAREANMYEPQEKIYFGSPKLWPFEDYFTLLDENQNKLLQMFKESGKESYVSWLEKKVLGE